MHTKVMWISSSINFLLKKNWKLEIIFIKKKLKLKLKLFYIKADDGHGCQ
jgi:hypothetical protein